MPKTREYTDMNIAYAAIRKIRAKGYGASLLMSPEMIAVVTFHAPKRILRKI